MGWRCWSHSRLSSLAPLHLLTYSRWLSCTPSRNCRATCWKSFTIHFYYSPASSFRTDGLCLVGRAGLLSWFYSLRQRASSSPCHHSIRISGPIHGKQLHNFFRLLCCSSRKCIAISVSLLLLSASRPSGSSWASSRPLSILSRFRYSARFTQLLRKQIRLEACSRRAAISWPC